MSRALENSSSKAEAAETMIKMKKLAKVAAKAEKKAAKKVDKKSKKANTKVDRSDDAAGSDFSS